MTSVTAFALISIAQILVRKLAGAIVFYTNLSIKSV